MMHIPSPAFDEFMRILLYSKDERKAGADAYMICAGTRVLLHSLPLHLGTHERSCYAVVTVGGSTYTRVRLEPLCGESPQGIHTASIGEEEIPVSSAPDKGGHEPIVGLRRGARHETLEDHVRIVRFGLYRMLRANAHSKRVLRKRPVTLQMSEYLIHPDDTDISHSMVPGRLLYDRLAAAGTIPAKCGAQAFPDAIVVAEPEAADSLWEADESFLLSLDRPSAQELQAKAAARWEDFKRTVYQGSVSPAAFERCIEELLGEAHEADYEIRIPHIAELRSFIREQAGKRK